MQARRKGLMVHCDLFKRNILANMASLYSFPLKFAKQIRSMPSSVIVTIQIYLNIGLYVWPAENPGVGKHVELCCF